MREGGKIGVDCCKVEKWILSYGRTSIDLLFLIGKIRKIETRK
jgi:hypothetical protein